VGIGLVILFIEEARSEASTRRPAEVTVRQIRRLSTSRSTLDEALFDEVRLIDFLYRPWVFPKGGGDGRQAYRPASELVYDHPEELIVDVVEAVAGDVQRL